MKKIQFNTCSGRVHQPLCLRRPPLSLIESALSRDPLYDAMMMIWYVLKEHMKKELFSWEFKFCTDMGNTIISSEFLILGNKVMALPFQRKKKHFISSLADLQFSFFIDKNLLVSFISLQAKDSYGYHTEVVA